MAANLDQIKLGEAVEAKDKETTAKMEERLAYSFGRAEWSLLFGVRNAGGFNADRACDAMAMGVWPSTGHKLLGFEIKVSRSDWLRELKDPWKAEAFAKFCDEWWLVIPKADIVKPGELPDGWGVMVPHGGGLKRAHHAKQREKPEPLERGLLAAMMKRSTTMENKEIEGHYQRGVDAGIQTAHRDYASKVERVAALEARIKTFQDISGVDIDNWRGTEKVAEAVKFVLAGGLENQRREMVRLDNCAAAIREEIAKLASECHVKGQENER